MYLPLYQKVLIIFAVFFLLPLGVLGGYVWRTTLTKTSTVLEGSVKDIAFIKYQNLNQYYEFTAGILEDMVSQPAIGNYINEATDENKIATQNTFARFQDTYWSKYHHIFLVNKVGDISVGAAHSGNINTHEGMSVLNNPKFMDVFKTKKLTVISHVNWTEGDHYHQIMALPIKDQTGTVLYILALELRIDYLNKVIISDGNIKKDQRFSARIVTLDGVPVHHSKFKDVSIKRLDPQILNQAVSEKYLYTSDLIQFTDSQHIVSKEKGLARLYLYDGLSPWVFVFDMKKHVAYSVLSGIKQFYIALFILLSLLLAALLFSLWKMVIQRITRLTNETQKLGTDEYAVYADDGDEIGILANTLYQASEKIKEDKNILETRVLERTRELNMQLRETQQFKRAVDESNSAVVITTKNHTILYVNKAAAELTGYTADELLGKTPKMFKSDKTEKAVYEELFLAIEHKKSFYTEELFNKKKTGEVYQASLAIYPVLDKEGNAEFFVGVQTDITERKRVETAKTEFVSLASHQLRTPLSAIRWYAEMLIEKPEEMTLQQLDKLSEIHQSTLRMINLVNAMLDVSRLESGTIMEDIVDVDMKEVLRATVDEQEVNAKNGEVILDVAIDEKVETIKADRKMARIITENLLSNAIKYTREKGKVFVVLSHIKSNTLLGDNFEKSGFMLVVQDSGIGIPKDQQHRIFEKMFRADNARNAVSQGTGLGLSAVKMIVEKLGGDIWFTSKKNMGTTFNVFVPYGIIKNNKK